jgi:hypothetical protein
MKDWFKYEFGYVNIDDENIYLTNSGNWSETFEIQEKTKLVDAKNNSKSKSLYLYVIAVVMLFGILLYFNMVGGGASIGLVVLIIAGGLGAKKYMQNEFGSRFKIPKSKILEIKFDQNNVELLFTNGDSENDSYLLEKVDKKGVFIFKSLVYKPNVTEL